MKTNTLPRLIVILILASMIAVALTSCQSDGAKLPASDETPAVQQSDQPSQPQTGQTNTLPDSAPRTDEPDLEAIKADWKSSPHASTFVLDENGQNNTCARCHAPVNWSPSMAELPESCFACKFELKEPAPLVPENAWTNISCNVCHEVDKKGNVQPEYAWLEIAPLEEYADVASPTELCLKCHAPVDIPNHGSVAVSGAHLGYECTRCHSAHSTTASCTAAGCHNEADMPAHDAYHQMVPCSTCHDGDGMTVDLDAESGKWLTYLPSAAGTDSSHFAFTSHNIVLEVDCSRCHFAGNPWGLTESVTGP